MQPHHREHGGGKGKTLWAAGQMYDSLIRHPANGWPRAAVERGRELAVGSGSFPKGSS